MCTVTKIIIFSTILLIASKSTHEFVSPTCPQGLYSIRANGKIQCCKYCPSGTHVLQHCSHGNVSSCQSCPKDHFYEKPNENTRCLRCTECSNLMEVKAACTHVSDTICVCKQDHFYQSLSNNCIKCKTCPIGYGILKTCSHTSQRTCEICKMGETFSDKINGLCQKCSQCGINEVKTRNCTLTNNAVCKKVPVPPTKPPDTITKLSIIIPTVSIILLLFIVIGGCICSRKIKLCHWNDDSVQRPISELERRSLDKPSSSSSGDGSSKEEQVPLRVSIPGDYTGEPLEVQGMPYLVREELAKLLDPKAFFGKNWRTLAGHMNYTQVDIEIFARDDSPTLRLLMEFGTKEDSTVNTLYSLLSKMKRNDCLKVLKPCLTSGGTNV